MLSTPTRDLELLEELGFPQYERRTLRTLMVHGVADAETLCGDGEIPSSKIYLALEKLGKLGLVEMQPTRPKLFSALSKDAVFARLVEISRERADRFAAQAQALRERFAALPSRESGRTTSSTLPWGRRAMLSAILPPPGAGSGPTMEQGDIAAIEGAKNSGAPFIAANCQECVRAPRGSSGRLWFRLSGGAGAGVAFEEASRQPGSPHRRSVFGRIRPSVSRDR